MTQGQTPAGWYDDGHGQLRWFDGTTWTEHTAPLPAPTPAPAAAEPTAPAAAAPVAAQPVAAQPVAQPVAAQPVTPGYATPAAAVGGAAAMGAYGEDPLAGGAAAYQQPYQQPAQPTPFYKKPLIIGLMALGLVIIAVAAFLALSGGSDSTSTSTTPTTAPTTPGVVPTNGASAPATGASFFGGQASAVAAAANCTVSATPTASAPVGTGAAPSSIVTCALGGTTYTVVTWATQADQDNNQSLLNLFPKAGTYYYASGAGWTAYDATGTQTGAQAFATAAGGTVKGIVVVPPTSAAAAPTA